MISICERRVCIFPIVMLSAERNPEDIPITSLPSIGSHRAKVLATVGIESVADLLYYFPRRYHDRSTIVPMPDLYKYVGKTVTCIGRITGIGTVARGKKRLVVTLRDQRGSMDIVFFQGIQYWQKTFSHDETLAVSGEVNIYGHRPNMVHPAIDRLEDEETMEFINTGGIVPVYPSSAELEKVGLNRHGGFRRIMKVALERYLSHVEDPLMISENASHTAIDDSKAATDTQQSTIQDQRPAIDNRGPTIASRHGLLPLRDALEAIHRPRAQEVLQTARHRLIFDEFFLLSLQLAYQKRRYTTKQAGIAFRIESALARSLIAVLPFQLTRAQKRVIREIAADMALPAPMNRLLQGDVGSGKTVVALLSMLVAVDNGYQCALMVPTEILAEQHYRTLTSLVNDIRVNIRLLTGQMQQSQRNEIVAGIAGGTVDIVVGTHALIQESVEFHNLGFVVIDEQHRFGVQQRASLRGKGAMPDVLVMTATPIPRTLSMTLYGDLDVSVIDELPANRKRIKTALRFEEDRPEVWDFLRKELSAGNQAFIVFPLVSESEKLDLKAATEEWEKLRTEVFPEFRIGLLHGQMHSKVKDDTMMQFKRGELDALVTTTVIEVGMDVPNATVMMIEHAERFGLAQLHQLRGRVGRGEKQSTCILMTEKRVFYAGGSKTADELQAKNDTRRRLETMRDTLDGFRIAEVDMEIRGPGDMWGTQQSGYPEFRIANLLTNGDILREARAEAFTIVETDPQLRLPEHDGIRRILGPKIRARMGLTDVG